MNFFTDAPRAGLFFVIFIIFLWCLVWRGEFLQKRNFVAAGYPSAVCYLHSFSLLILTIKILCCESDKFFTGAPRAGLFFVIFVIFLWCLVWRGEFLQKRNFVAAGYPSAVCYLHSFSLLILTIKILCCESDEFFTGAPRAGLFFVIFVIFLWSLVWRGEFLQKRNFVAAGFP